jgi:hypothetical protein
VSSILDALRKVEADERRTPMRLPPPEPRPRGRLAALVAAAAFVAGAAVVALVVFLRPGAAPEPTATEVASAPPAVVPPVAPAPEAAPIAPPAAAAPAQPAPVGAATAAPVAPTDAAPPAAPAPVVEEPIAEAESDVPEQITILRPAPAPTAAPAPAPDAGAQAEVQVEALPTPAPAEPPIDVLPGPPAGAPEIHVSFLIYSAVPARRQVSLTIDNGPLITLHEGQKSGSISLVRILRDRIHVEHGGRTYSVRAVL